MSFRITWEPHGACIRYSGHVSDGEFVDSAEELCSDSRFDALRFVIGDCTQVTGHDITPRGVERVAVIRLGAKHSNPNVRILVVATDESPGSMADRSGLAPHLERRRTPVFRTQGEARMWLLAVPPLMHARFLGAPKSFARS